MSDKIYYVVTLAGLLRVFVIIYRIFQEKVPFPLLQITLVQTR
jgi:hypothetical protein